MVGAVEAAIGGICAAAVEETVEEVEEEKRSERGVQ